jgi:hypothetical protein
VAVVAVQQIRRMRGGAQGQLMLASDRRLYVVKFQNNPQHVRVLANEFLATRLAEAVGLSVPRCEVVEVSAWLIANSPELTMLSARGGVPCAAGLQFGSELVGGMIAGQLVDYLPAAQLHEVKNLAEFAGMLALDKWTGNANGRQAVFLRKSRERKYRAVFIDQGYCFGAGEWGFRDAPLRGVYGRISVYGTVTGWHDFAPWLERLENFPAEKVWAAAEQLPPEWYGDAPAELEQLVVGLLARRSRVRELIDSFRMSDRRPFPAWGKPALAVVAQFQEWKGTGGTLQ